MTEKIYEFSNNLISEILNAKKEIALKDYKVDFYIHHNIKFSDDKWNLEHCNTNNRSPQFYRYDFARAPISYKDSIKLLTLEELVIKKNKFSSVKQTATNAIHISRWLYSNGCTDPRLIQYDDVKRYIDLVQQKNKPSRTEKKAIYFKKLLYVIQETAATTRYVKSISYLKEVQHYSQLQTPTSSTNEYIPDKFLNQLISLAVKDIDNKDLSVDSKIFSCLLIILGETGMRAEELSLLKTNSLDSIKINKGSANYLIFNTFKTTRGTSEATETYTYMSSLATKAYQKAELFVEEILKQHSVYKTSKKNSRKRKALVTNENFSYSAASKLDKPQKSFIFISSITGELRKGTSVLREHFQRFLIRHYEEIDLSILSQKERELINFFEIKAFSKYKKMFTVDKREEMSFEKVKNIKYPHVNLHRFRVTVCTKLFLQKVHLDYIVKHMNHLSEDMTVYYNKSHTFKNELEENMKILSFMTNEQGLLETDPKQISDVFIKSEVQNQEITDKIKKINQFLEQNKLNILNDTKKIFKMMLKTNSTIAENEFGMCMKSLIHGLCERKKYFSTMSDNYFIGIQLENYKFLNLNYERFKQKLEVVNHNRMIAEKDNRYINEFQREENALKGFINKTLKKEIELLRNDLDLYGRVNVCKQYPYLSEFVDNLNLIEREMEQWILK
ncbi:hypothetical protein MMB68_10380 [Priestia sp. Y58]|uniref:hypothetical protein n=1 Tax=Priestia sp. Y58 TaxID=2922804 RepID=UPI002407368A|nr:hypothetical protein [Priestia sp. Y58]MDG0029962.1 hypothetical protein [Priestia sp. Y58]